MAYYAALVSLVQLLEDIIHRDRYQNLLPNIQQKTASVYGKFSLLQILVDEFTSKDDGVAELLERRIRDAAYQTQYIIESNISNAVEIHGVKRVFRHLISPLQKAIIGRDNQGLEKVKKQVDSIVEGLLRIKRDQTTEDLQLNGYSADVGTSKRAHSQADKMEGVEERLMMIKHQLCGEPSKLQIVSIVGMGGIGKTTLARNIFDDQLIVDRFDYRAWITISENYLLEKILLDIVDSMNVPNNQLGGEGELGEKIYKHLKGRRYLIIMDDVWETKIWDDIKRVLPNDSNGSRIMIITRISDVAFYAGSSDFFHLMQTLNEDQSWNLFRKSVSCPPELEDIGRLIANNCGGLPLAIVVVAGLLSKVNKKRSNWEEIAKNVSLAAVEDDEQFSKILSVSYYHLPHHLKPLFLYMGSLPDNNEFIVFDLVTFWIAEGFLKPIESKSLEEIAEEYLDDLVKRNLVLITEKTFTNKIRYCRIHDVLRDLCRKLVCDDNFFHILHKDSSIYPTATRDVRRIYVYCHQPTLENAKRCGPQVRFIFHSSRHNDPSIPIFDPPISLSFVMKFRLLRILRAVEASLRHFPTEILKLFHLRYLALCQSVLPIPPSISKLQNLQTLIIVASNFTETFSPLPSQIWEMPNLRHIMVCPLKLSSMSKERIVGVAYVLENLQTLLCPVNMSFSDEVIEMIPNLKKLKVNYDASSSVWQRFHLNNLFHLRQLKKLSICFTDWYHNTVHPFPESFAFPSNLNKLSLKGCKIPWKDMTAVGSLPNLQILKLGHDAFTGEKWESTEGEFTQLKFLLIERLGIKYWLAENSHFPRLQCLKISYCENLQEIPLEIGEISTLELVEVYSSELAALSALKMQEEQLDMGNDALQIRVYPQYRNFREEET